jgi:hypothetical protein
MNSLAAQQKEGACQTKARDVDGYLIPVPQEQGETTLIRILLIAALMLPTAARAEPAVTPIQETALVTGWSVMLYSKHCKALSQETKMVAIQMIAESKASPAAVEYWMDKLDGLRIKEGNDTFCRAVEEVYGKILGPR